MKTAAAFFFLAALALGCVPPRPVVVRRGPVYRHDNGRHRGWYKTHPGQGPKRVPPGWAKKGRW